MLLFSGIFLKKCSSASRPPAEAPIPTIGKYFVLFFTFLEFRLSITFEDLSIFRLTGVELLFLIVLIIFILLFSIID